MARISTKNQVTIPVAALAEAGLHAGDRVVVEALDDGELRVGRGAATFDSAFGALTGSYPDRYLERLISVVKLSEVLVAPAAESGRLLMAREAVAALGVAVHRPGESIGVEAAPLRRRHPISHPDAYCLATAKHVGAVVASFDHMVIRAAEAERIAHTAS